MTIKTEQFEFSHGCKPSGFGTWFFEISDGSIKSEIMYTDTYAKARDAAVGAFIRATEASKHGLVVTVRP